MTNTQSPAPGVAADELQSLREADEMLKEIGSMCRDQTMFVGSYAEIVRQALASRTPATGKGKCHCDHHEHCSVCTPHLWVRKSEVAAPGMAGGVGADTFTFDPAGLRMLWNAVGEPGNFNGDFMVAARRLAASTSSAAVIKDDSGLYRALDLIVNCDALAEPLANGKRRDPDDEEQRQQRIETVLDSGRRALAAYDAAPHPAPAVQVAGAELCIAPDVLQMLQGYDESEGGPIPRGTVYALHTEKLAMGYVPLSVSAIEAGRAGS